MSTEIVALHDIELGEKVFMDYGSEWVRNGKKLGMRIPRPGLHPKMNESINW